MAKSTKSAADQTDRGRKTTARISPEFLRERAVETRQLAELLEQWAETMERCNVKPFSSTIGNFNQAIANLKSWIGIQVRSKIIVAAEKNGFEIDVSIGKK